MSQFRFKKCFASKRNLAKQKRFRFVSLQFRETTNQKFRFVSLRKFRFVSLKKRFASVVTLKKVSLQFKVGVGGRGEGRGGGGGGGVVVGVSETGDMRQDT